MNKENTTCPKCSWPADYTGEADVEGKKVSVYVCKPDCGWIGEEQIPKLEPYLIEYICPDCDDNSSWISLSGKNICPIHKKHVTQKIFAYMKESVHEREEWILSKFKLIQKIINENKSNFPLVDIGRQNVLNDIDNEVQLDELIKQLERKE